MPFNNRSGRGGRFLFFPLVAVVMVLVLGAVVRLLWNMILPSIVHAEPITYWQAVGLLLLCRILFGNFPPGRRGPGFKGGGGPWKDKLMHMTAEEREKFREEWRRRCMPGNKKEI
jgi:hypothetical protein